MHKRDYISIDNAFQDKLASHEMPFQDGDWSDMLSKLESDDGAIIILPDKHIFTNFKHIIIMTILTFITSGILWLSGPQSVDVGKQQQVTSTATKTITSVTSDPITQGGHNTIELVLPKEVKTQIKQTTQQSNTSVVNNIKETASAANKVTETIGAVLEVPVKVFSPDTAKFMKTVVSKYWVDTTYTYIYHKPSRDIEEGWIGMYYTNQQMMDAMDWERIGRHTETHGFNLQFMSGNVLKGENLAIYGGVEWGMQFYGRSDNSEVLINSVNEDRGLSYLRSHSNDFYINSQIEWAQFPIVPYIHGAVGGRILSTGQTIKALLPSTEYESSQENGVHTRAALSSKFGVGAKLRLTPRMYLDARYNVVHTRELETVDYNNTGFNGLDYDLGFRKLNMNANQFQIGIVFDVSSENRTKVVDEPGHWEETKQVLYVDPADSSKVFVPCPCDKPSKNRRSRNNSRTYYPDFEDGIFTPGSGGGSRGGSGGGSGKSGFPGLKTPPVRW